MKLIAQFKDILSDFNGNSILSLSVSNYAHKSLINSLKKDINYSVEIKEVKNKRTLQQNSYLWALIREIDIEINGKPTDEMDIYIMALERANAKCEYITCYKEAENLLKENFRAVQFVQKCDLNGHEANMYKVYIGSSKMDTKEMGLLIDTVLDIAQEVGIETAYWYEVLK